LNILTAGNFWQLFAPDGWEFHKHIATKCKCYIAHGLRKRYTSILDGGVVKVKALFGVR